MMMERGDGIMEGRDGGEWRERRREVVGSRSLDMILLGRSIDNRQMRYNNKNDRMATKG
jgi:hypothetical protein